MKEKVVNTLKDALSQQGIDWNEKDIKEYIEIPPKVSMGDYAFPCFSLAKELKKSPQQIAIDIRSYISQAPEGFSEVQTAGPYINFYLDKKQLAEKLINEILEKGFDYGTNSLGNGNKSMVEFSQPNTHKAFHVGHIRGTSIGESLSRISRFCGENVIRANYSGDTGMHIAKWLWCYLKFHSGEELKKDESWIASIYVEAAQKLEGNEQYQKEVEEINKKIESRSDEKINDLWEKTRKISIDAWKKIYDELNTFFDVHYFESEEEKPGKEIAENLVEKGIAKRDQGAVIVDLKEHDLGVWIVLRSDGTVLYAAKDLALAKRKMDEYDLDRSLVVIGTEQDTYFTQLEKVLELMGLKNYQNYSHLPYEMVRLPHGKMSSRTGDNILYSDFMDEMKEYVRERIKEKGDNVSAEELEERTLKVSVAAIKYAMLKQSPNKIIVFDKEQAINFEGDTGPYMQYTYARASSILEKGGIPENWEVYEFEEKEIELLKKLYNFGDVVQKSYKKLDPSLVAHYSYELSQLFNEFYHSCPVVGSEKQAFRLKLVQAFRQVLKNSLSLLGIEVMEKM